MEKFLEKLFDTFGRVCAIVNVATIALFVALVVFGKVEFALTNFMWFWVTFLVSFGFGLMWFKEQEESSEEEER